MASDRAVRGDRSWLGLPSASPAGGPRDWLASHWLRGPTERRGPRDSVRREESHLPSCCPSLHTCPRAHSLSAGPGKLGVPLR